MSLSDLGFYYKLTSLSDNSFDPIGRNRLILHLPQLHQPTHRRQQPYLVLGDQGGGPEQALHLNERSRHIWMIWKWDPLLLLTGRWVNNIYFAELHSLQSCRKTVSATPQSLHSQWTFCPFRARLCHANESFRPPRKL